VGRESFGQVTFARFGRTSAFAASIAQPSRTEKIFSTPLFFPESVPYLSPRAFYDIQPLRHQVLAHK
jgi:hypothetical protein